MVAGGSGGHIYPATTLASALVNRGHEIFFVGSNDRMEKDVIPAMGFNYEGLNVYTTRGGVLQKVKSLVSIYFAYLKCLKMLKGYDVAIGFGNYISVPVIKAAHKLGVKVILHEQNSFVGRANRMLDNDADFIIGSYQENLEQFKNPNIEILGNPQSSKALEVKKNKDVLKSMGLDPDKKTVVIFMGSLGSESVEKVLIEMFGMLDGSYQVVYATGSSHYQNVISQVKETEYLKIFEKIDGVNVMVNSDLLVCRAGATTLSEISAIGMPSILIPSPYVPNNHQYKNGMALVNKNAALMLEEKNLTALRLKEMIDETINNDQELNTLKMNARSLNNDHVVEDIIAVVENI